MKLNLGCGTRYKNGWVNIDNCQQNSASNVVKCDINADVFTLKYDEDTVDEIDVNHFAMYISRQNMPIQLSKWYKWLKVGGNLTIESGDIGKIAKNIIFCIECNDNHKLESVPVLMQLFGWEESAGHKWAWCETNLKPLLIYAGFKEENIKFGPGISCDRFSAIRDFRVIAIK